MPTAALALTYWLHLMATVVWIGGLAMLTLVVWPGRGEDSAAWALLDSIERRFRPLANISLIVLLATGVIQMGGDPHYRGFLVVNSLWTVGLLAKHIVIGAMIITTFILQGQILPALDRAKLLANKGNVERIAQEAVLRHRLRLLTAASLALGVLALLLTAIITALP